MLENIKEKNVKDWRDEDEVRSYLKKFSTNAFDHSGLIYGMGHAVLYTCPIRGTGNTQKNG